MAEKISMTPNELSEAQRGWFRTMVTSAVGVISLVTSTWLVISSITEVKHTVKTNTTTVQTINHPGQGSRRPPHPESGYNSEDGIGSQFY